MKKKITAAIASLVLAVPSINMLPVSADDIVLSGKCGDSAYWSLDSEGTFTISGSGSMYSWEYSYYSAGSQGISVGWREGFESPWFDIRENIKTLIVEEGITSLGCMAFADCDNLTEVSLPDSLVNCGRNTFLHCGSLTEIDLPDSLEIINSCFEYCTKLTHIEIPETVTHIADRTFAMCSSLQTVVAKNTECYFPAMDSVFTTDWDSENYRDVFTGMIYCRPDSDTEAYCIEYELPYTTFERGDVNSDRSINSVDASMILAEYAGIATGNDTRFDSVEAFCADTDSDGSVNSSDASSILSYYAYTATGGTEAFEEFLK